MIKKKGLNNIRIAISLDFQEICKITKKIRKFATKLQYTPTPSD
mgnify:CR=1 FL=1